MAFVFRDFDIHRKQYGDKGNIEIFTTNEGNFLNVFVFGLNHGTGHAYMKVIPSEKLDLYDNCMAILNQITKNFENHVYLGYRDFIDVSDEDIELSKDTTLSELLIKDKEFPEVEFTRKNVKYLTIYERIYKFSIENTYQVIAGKITDDGIFQYDEYAYLHYEDVN